MTDFSTIHADFSSFETLYTDEIEPKLQTMEQERQQKLKGFWRGLAIAVAVGAAIGGLLFFLFGHAVVAGIGGLVVAGVGIAIAYMPLGKVNKQAHDFLMETVISALDMAYTEKGFTPPEFSTFRSMKLLPSDDRRSFEDLVTGTRHGADFFVYEAHLETVTRDKDGDETWHTVFRGQLLKIGYPKKFLGKTVVARDAGWFNGMSKPGKDYSKVGIASPRFEKLFEAWSTDQVEARELLDPVVLERFLELENLFDGKKPRAAFADGALYLAVETGNVMQKGSSFASIASRERVASLLKEFAIIYDLIDVIVKPVEGRIEGSYALREKAGKQA
ncbi:DUF3137 domain-containing protein [Parvularcula flava]|uniref:DUF3137 domain-containing protein n=1 Tax=Aquisalinus luteolus TaxID=1566827 RepID=A0A8J3A9Q6_9PROT|nr:DUF3137 domain-containing protein [Aquisalinus luteolus]NHK29009.1 DUF3137 domain-containing protein [Aquisalinus luteolus]GGI00591.1 hypothetical protein GCM10011355_29240 [Aquisalinus luteolus]